VHGDDVNAIDIVKNVKKELESIGFIFEKLDKLKKFN
jgi:lactam utilization protein B